MPKPTKPSARPSAQKPKSKAVSKPAKPGPAKKAKLARPPSSSDSDGSESDGDDEEDDRAAMLAALEAHSRSMFGLDAPESSAQGAARAADSESGSGSESECGTPAEDDYDDEFDDGWGEGDAFVTDSEDGMDFDAMMSNAKKAKTAAKGKGKAKKEAPKAAPSAPKPAATVRAPVEVVFAETGRGVTAVSKAEKRAFLTGNSSKIMGLQAEDQPGSGKRKRRAEAEDDEEQSNQRLDRSLHEMLLTSLLPAAKEDAAARPVDKRAAMSGRLLELANYSIPGEGEGVVRGANMSSHPAKVRTGLVHAQQRRAETARAEAEAAGSWVKGKGGLGDLGRRGAGGKGKEREVRTFGTTTKKKGMDGRKKERAMGLGMGVGKFDKGSLRIDESTIARVNGGGGKKRKGGGKKGMRGW